MPSRVDGINDVSEATIFPDRLELLTPSGRTAYRFEAIGRDQTPVIASGLKRFLPMWPSPELVADRDWFHKPPNRFFTFDLG